MVECDRVANKSFEISTATSHAVSSGRPRVSGFFHAAPMKKRQLLDATELTPAAVKSLTWTVHLANRKGVAVLDGGPDGAATALALARRGYAVCVLCLCHADCGISCVITPAAPKW
jgi:hypothetical protein